MTLKAGQKHGYYDGYRHGIDGNRYNPAPKLLAVISNDTYLKIYLEHYDKGFCEGKRHRETLLRVKPERDAREHEIPLERE